MYPNLSMCIISGILWSISDIIAQLLAMRNNKLLYINYYHTLYLFLYSSIFWCNLCTIWYQLLIQLIPDNTILDIIVRVIIDQTVFTGILMCCYIVFNGLINGYTFKQSMHAIQLQFISNIKLSWIVWLPVSILNTTVIPIEYRMTFINTVNLPFTIILAYKNNETADKIDNNNDMNMNNNYVSVVPAMKILTQRAVNKQTPNFIDITIDDRTNDSTILPHEKV